MQVVILCGGQGTRMREETEYRPKPLVEVGGRPVLWHIMRLFAHHGLREFVLCLGYRGDMIRQYFLNYKSMTRDCRVNLHTGNIVHFNGVPNIDWDVTLADTGLDTMTGGRVQKAARHIAKGEPFIVTYGDGLANVDIGQLIAFHKSHGKLATVTTVRPQSRFGILDIESGGQVTRFAEKPQSDGWMNAGYFVFQPQVLDYIDGDDCILERGPLERLAREGQLMAHRHDGFFFAMDTYREYLTLNEMWNSGNAPWKVWE